MNCHFHRNKKLICKVSIQPVTKAWNINLKREFISNNYVIERFSNVKANCKYIFLSMNLLIHLWTARYIEKRASRKRMLVYFAKWEEAGHGGHAYFSSHYAALCCNVWINLWELCYTTRQIHSKIHVISLSWLKGSRYVCMYVCTLPSCDCRIFHNWVYLAIFDEQRYIVVKISVVYCCFSWLYDKSTSIGTRSGVSKLQTNQI